MDFEARDQEKREYELAVLMANEAEAPSFGDGVEVVRTEGPKTISLAYPIKKHTSVALFVYILRCLPEVAAGLNASLQSQHSILRHLLITPPIHARRGPEPIVPLPEKKEEKVIPRPAQPDTITNQALEEALEKILENEPKPQS